MYFPVGLNLETAGHFFIYYGYSLLLSWAATGMGFSLGVCFEDKTVALGLVPMALIPLMLLSGFFVNPDIDCYPDCDPMKTYDFDETMGEGIIATTAIGVGFYMLAYILLRILAHRAK